MEYAIYGIHAGIKGEVEELFIENSIIALGLPEIGDLSQFNSLREVYDAFMKTYKGEFRYMSKASRGSSSGTLFRFSHLLSEGDYFLLYSLKQKKYFIGQIIGPYEFRKDLSERYPHIRKVAWLTAIPRNNASIRVQKAMNCGQTMFGLDKYREDIIAMLNLNFPLG